MLMFVSTKAVVPNVDMDIVTPNGYPLMDNGVAWASLLILINKTAWYMWQTVVQTWPGIQYDVQCLLWLQLHSKSTDLCQTSHSLIHYSSSYLCFNEISIGVCHYRVSGAKNRKLVTSKVLVLDIDFKVTCTWMMVLIVGLHFDLIAERSQQKRMREGRL